MSSLEEIAIRPRNCSYTHKVMVGCVYNWSNVNSTSYNKVSSNILKPSKVHWFLLGGPREDGMSLHQHRSLVIVTDNSQECLMFFKMIQTTEDWRLDTRKIYTDHCKICSNEKASHSSLRLISSFAQRTFIRSTIRPMLRRFFKIIPTFIAYSKKWNDHSRSYAAQILQTITPWAFWFRHSWVFKGTPKKGNFYIWRTILPMEKYGDRGALTTSTKVRVRSAKGWQADSPFLHWSKPLCVWL